MKNKLLVGALLVGSLSAVSLANATSPVTATAVAPIKATDGVLYPAKYSFAGFFQAIGNGLIGGAAAGAAAAGVAGSFGVPFDAAAVAVGAAAGAAGGVAEEAAIYSIDAIYEYGD